MFDVKVSSYDGTDNRGLLVEMGLDHDYMPHTYWGCPVSWTVELGGISVVGD